MVENFSILFNRLDLLFNVCDVSSVATSSLFEILLAPSFMNCDLLPGIFANLQSNVYFLSNMKKKKKKKKKKLFINKQIKTTKSKI